MFTDPDAVSYTHLDVYKRQVLNAINNSNLGKKAVIMGDVYMDSQKGGRVVARPVFKEGNRAGYIKVNV